MSRTREKSCDVLLSSCLAGSLEKYVQTLEKKFKFDVLKQVYAGVNGMSTNDPEMVQFFKMKMWM